MPMMASPKKTEFKGDKEFATYRWELYLTNGKIFDGYSKNVGQDEKHDKQQLFQDCICRLLNNGYLDKTYQMFFYKRQHLHRSQDTLLLEMYQTHYVAHDHLTLDLSTTNFLDRIYKARQTGLGLDYKEYLPPRISRREQEKADFEFSTVRFPTLQHLIEYCKTSLLPRYARPRIEAWYHANRHCYAQAASVPTGEPLVGPSQADPHNQQATKAAQQAIQSFQNKHVSNR